MRAIRRAIAPVLLVILGVAAMVEGMLYHPIAVVIKEETTTTKTIDIPLTLPPGLPDEPPSPGGEGTPYGGPTSIKQTVPFVEPAIVEMVPEPEVVRDVSVGGIVRLDSGELKRTYSGKGPALCPS